MEQILAKRKADLADRRAILGLVGGIVGGFLGNLIGAGDGWIMSILLAIAGSCLVVWIARKLAR